MRIKFGSFEIFDVKMQWIFNGTAKYKVLKMNILLLGILNMQPSNVLLHKGEKFNRL